MEIINIKDKEYQFVSDFKNNKFLRKSFNKLTQKVYEFNFENWYLNGYWGDKYIPYSLLDDDKIVANVSINLIDFWVNEEEMVFLQIGTVMTDSEYRNRGLSKALLYKVLEGWRGKCDLIYLFANDTVLNFYSKFGFRRFDEYQYSKNMSSVLNNTEPQKLDMALKTSRDLVVDKINSKEPISQISMKGNAGLVMFYLTWFMSENVYHLNQFDAIVIANYQNNILYLQDIFCEEFIELDEVISAMANENVKKVVLGFTPKDISSFQAKHYTSNDILFVLDDKRGIFKKTKMLFPVLSHA